MHFKYVLSLLTVCASTSADCTNDKSPTCNKKDYPFKEDEYSTEENIPRKIDLSEVHFISDALQLHLNNLEELYHYLPPAEAYFFTRWGNTNKKPGFLSLIHRIFKTDPLFSYNDELQGNGTKRRTVKCKHLLRSNSIINNAVEIVNSTRLQNILKSDSNVTSDDTLGVCVVVYFYSNECPFSLIAAPHFKLFAHLFPQIKMIGINSINNQWINNMYNIIGIPTVILFHNGNPIAKNEYAENTFYELSKFIILHTDLNPVDIKKIYLMELINAVNRVTPRALKPDYTLWLAWFVIIFWIVYYAITKDLWTKYVNKIQNILFGNEENEQ